MRVRREEQRCDLRRAIQKRFGIFLRSKIVHRGDLSIVYTNRRCFTPYIPILILRFDPCMTYVYGCDPISLDEMVGFLMSQGEVVRAKICSQEEIAKESKI